MKELSQKHIQRIIEAALLTSHKPLTFQALYKLVAHHAPAPSKDAVHEAIEALMQHYQKRGIHLKEVASGFRFEVDVDITPFLAPLFEEKPTRYSRALLETMAIIAYRQPITRGEIESIRGVVVSTHTIRTLEEHEWIKVVGHKDVPGRPALFATTKYFLDHFGLKQLSQLPPLSDITDLDALLPETPEQPALPLESTEETTHTEPNPELTTEPVTDATCEESHVDPG